MEPLLPCLHPHWMCLSLLPWNDSSMFHYLFVKDFLIILLSCVHSVSSPSLIILDTESGKYSVVFFKDLLANFELPVWILASFFSKKKNLIITSWLIMLIVTKTPDTLTSTYPYDSSLLLVFFINWLFSPKESERLSGNGIQVTLQIQNRYTMSTIRRKTWSTINLSGSSYSTRTMQAANS